MHDCVLHKAKVKLIYKENRINEYAAKMITLCDQYFYGIKYICLNGDKKNVDSKLHCR